MLWKWLLSSTLDDIMSESHKEARYFRIGGLFLYGTGQRAAGSIHFSRRKTLTWRGPKQNITSLFAAQHGYVLPQQTKKKSEKET